MGSHRINGQPWPDGTSVGLYYADQLPVTADAPAGTVLQSEAVGSGFVEFEGLEEGRRYVAYALGKAVRFLVQPGAVDQLAPIRGEEARTFRELADQLEEGLDAGPINVMVSLPPFADVRRDGVTDDSAALQLRHDLAEDTGQAVYYPAGLQPYIAANLMLASNARVLGDLFATVVKMPANAPQAVNGGGSDLATTHRFVFVNKHGGGAGNTGISICGLTLDGNVANGNAVDEFYFGVALYGVKGARIGPLKVQNMRGDGIYVGWDGSVESTDVEIEGIHLDNVGVDAGAGNARQGIAIVQCRRFTIRDVYANKVGGTGLSFIVDVEPNAAADVCEDGTIEGIHGIDCVGGVQVMAQAGGATRGIHVDDVTMRDGPTNTISSIVSVARTDGVSIGSRLYTDVATASLSSGRRVFISDASPPTNLTVVNTRVETQTRAATTVVQPDTRLCLITGAGAVSGMAKSWPGHVVTFNVVSGVSFTDGAGTVRLAGNFAPADGNSTLTLLCVDGTNWIEVGRSVNG